MEKTFEQATLSCGLRVIYEHKPSAVLYCGYVVCAGTRHEDVADSGMASMLRLKVRNADALATLQTDLKGWGAT